MTEKCMVEAEAAIRAYEQAKRDSVRIYFPSLSTITAIPTETFKRIVDCLEKTGGDPSLLDSLKRCVPAPPDAKT